MITLTYSNSDNLVKSVELPSRKAAFAAARRAGFLGGTVLAITDGAGVYYAETVNGRTEFAGAR